MAADVALPIVVDGPHSVALAGDDLDGTSVASHAA